MAFSSLCRRHSSRILVSSPFISLFLCDSTHPHLFLSPFSSATKPVNPNQSASRVLFENLGFPSSERLKINKTFTRIFTGEIPLKRSVESIQLFKSYGFNDPQLRTMFAKRPTIFTLRADQVLRPRLELIKALGFSNQELTSILCKAPRTLCVKDLEANIAFYRTVYHGNVNLVTALKRFPILLTYTSRTTPNEQLKFLKQYGFCNDSIHCIIMVAPCVLCCSTDLTRLRLEFLENIGFKLPMKTFHIALSLTIPYSLQKLHQKYHHLMALGLTEDEVKQVIQKSPMVLRNSCDKVRRIVDYLQSKGVEPRILILNPLLCGMSLEKRIIPRYHAFRFLCETLGQEKIPSFPRVIKMTEKEFMKSYVEGKPHAKKLLRIYRAASKASPP